MEKKLIKSNQRKGIIVSAGKAQRLMPISAAISKSMMPIYDKPMLYYSIYIMMQADIKDVMFLIAPDTQNMYEMMIGHGEQLGMNITYIEQPKQIGIADAFIQGEEFIGDSPVMVLLGDNIFYSPYPDEIENIINKVGEEATIFGTYVADPRRFGVVEANWNTGEVKSIEEKPENPKSNYAVPGIYFYPNDVVQKAKKLKPSDRGELEITDINKAYMEEGNLKALLMDRVKWFDIGTIESLINTSNYFRKLEEHNGQIICCPEEKAFRKGWITREEVLETANKCSKTKYGKYLYSIIK